MNLGTDRSNIPDAKIRMSKSGLITLSNLADRRLPDCSSERKAMKVKAVSCGDPSHGSIRTYPLSMIWLTVPSSTVTDMPGEFRCRDSAGPSSGIVLCDDDVFHMIQTRASPRCLEGCPANIYLEEESVVRV